MKWLKRIQSFLFTHLQDQKACELRLREQRIEQFKNNEQGFDCIKMHSFINRVMMPVLRFSLCLSGDRLFIKNDRSHKSSRPIIYCPTHIGGKDIEMSFLGAGNPCWILMGDPRELYKNFDGFLLQLNGWIPFDSDSKEDRHAARHKMIQLLKSGANIVMFPEGAQNISPNKLVGYLFPGAVELAIICNAEIVPMAFARIGNDYYCNVGENISYDHCRFEDKKKLVRELRDSMATLQWELLENFPPDKRNDINESYYDTFIDGILDVGSDYTWTLEDILSTRCNPKDVTEPKDAFLFMKGVIPRKDSAFLFNKRLIGTV